MKRIAFIQLILITGWCAMAYGQVNDASNNIVGKLAAWSASHLVEKTYLQFDKPYYAAGDTIYFKAYVTKGEQHRLSDLSGVLHVDLINIKNKIDQSIKLQLDSGVAWGDFALPDSLPGGNYRIRAYTQLMRNNGEMGFFDKIIPIGSLKVKRIPESLAKQSVMPVNLKPDIQFFPEGGGFITGIRSKAAFKAIGPGGMGVDVKGTIVDDQNNEVAAFASAHLGMGSFYITPAEGRTYMAKVTYPNGVQATIDLSKTETAGIMLSVNNDSLPKASVRITANTGFYHENKDKDYRLVIYSQGLVTSVSFKLDSPEIKLDILKRKLHTGIATVTLFSSQNEPLSERALFVQNYDHIDLNINGDKGNYAKREKATISLNAKNRKGEPAEGHFSVSVIDESKVPEIEKNGANILTHFLLTSDLKGYVEQPDYYFSDTSMMASKNLDLVMLTQGYRRFTWKQVPDSAEQTLSYQPETGIEINGQLKSLFGRPVANGTVTLISQYKGPVFSSMTDDKGMFRFSNLIFTDTAHFVLSAVNAKNDNSTKITYFNDERYAPAVQQNQQQVVQQAADSAMSEYVRNDKLRQQGVLSYFNAKGVMLKQVSIHEKKPDDQYRTQSFAGAGHADQVMHADEIGKIGGQLSTSLNGRLHGVSFSGGIPYLKIGNNGPMLVVVDGAYIPMNRPGRKGQMVDNIGVNIINSNDVETVEVLKYASTSIYGVEGGNGVLIITTKLFRTLSSKDIASIGVLPIAPVGFYKAREFYSPKYENTAPAGKQQDLRSTIYWKPELVTGKDGNASFDYYNADGPGTYKIVVEGIDNNGNIGRQVYNYKVE